MNMEERLRTLQNFEGMDAQIQTWNKENATILPQGKGEVSGEYPHYLVTIFWGKNEDHCELSHVGPSGCLVENVDI
jgi:hypothetical protein